jgi:hypothetical protein
MLAGAVEAAMLRITGFVLAAVGIAAGVLLALSAFGILAAPPGRAAWMLFPLCAVGGWLFAALGSPTSALRKLAKGFGAILLAMGLVIAGLLVAASFGLLPVVHGTGPLWFVFALSILAGGAFFTAPDSPQVRA